MLQMAHPLASLVHKLRRLGSISERDQAVIRALPHHTRAVRPQETLIRQGDTPDHCTLLLSGLAARDRTTSAGARQLLGFCVAGDFLDLDSGLMGCAHDNVQMIGAGEIACISLDALTHLAFAHPIIGRLLWIDTLIHASIAREWILNVGRRDARTRLLHLLCELATRQEQAGVGGHHELTLPLTQEQLADALGLTSVHVNRMLQSLRDEPAIERAGRTIRIKDWRSIARMADFDDAYLRIDAVQTIADAY